MSLCIPCEMLWTVTSLNVFSTTKLEEKTHILIKYFVLSITQISVQNSWDTIYSWLRFVRVSTLILSTLIGRGGEPLMSAYWSVLIFPNCARQHNRPLLRGKILDVSVWMNHQPPLVVFLSSSFLHHHLQINSTSCFAFLSTITSKTHFFHCLPLH